MSIFSDERLGIPMLPVPGTKHRALLLTVWHGNHPVLEKLASHSDKYLDCEGGTQPVESPYKGELFAPLVVSFVQRSAALKFVCTNRGIYPIRTDVYIPFPWQVPELQYFPHHWLVPLAAV